MYKKRSLKELYRIARGEEAPCCEKAPAEKSCSGGGKMDSCCGVEEIANCCDADMK